MFLCCTKNAKINIYKRRDEYNLMTRKLKSILLRNIQMIDMVIYK